MTSSSDNKTEWMYASTNKPDLEQYLLGRRIDDAVDPTQDTNTPTDWVSLGPSKTDVFGHQIIKIIIGAQISSSLFNRVLYFRYLELSLKLVT